MEVISIGNYWTSYAKKKAIEKSNSNLYNSTTEIPIIYLKGMIGVGQFGSSINVKKLKKVTEDIIKSKKSEVVIFHVSCPGGSPVESQIVHDIITKLQSNHIYVICLFHDVAASGGYYFSSPADTIVSNPLCITGSIGVTGGFVDATGLKKWGIEGSHFREGDVSLVAINEQETEKKAQLFESAISRYYQEFLQVVSNGRNISMKDLEKVAEGRPWLGIHAYEQKLVDRIGGTKLAIALATDAANMIRRKEKMKFRNARAIVVHHELNTDKWKDFYGFPLIFLPDSWRESVELLVKIKTLSEISFSEEPNVLFLADEFF